MKKWISLMAVCAVMFMGMGMSYAGNGKGAMDGTGPIHDITAGEPFTVTGDVVSMVKGDGIVLDVGDENIAIFGLGPYWYWDDQPVDRPVVGDTITVTGFAVDYNGVDRNIAMSVTIDGTAVQLRDADTGAPLWKGGKGKANGRK